MPRQVPRGGASLRTATEPVWDLPVRLVHWLLAGLVAFSWWSVHNNHTDWHIWSGCGILALLVFRILWGFIGSSTARFATFVRGPRALHDYVRGSRVGIGHNPLGALSVLALLTALLVQVGLGLVSQDEDGISMGPLAHFVSSETSDQARHVHALWFNVVLGLIGLHLAAILVYRLRGEKLTLPMITGRARIGSGQQPMQKGKWWAALICLGIATGTTGWVIAGAPPFGP